VSYLHTCKKKHYCGEIATLVADYQHIIPQLFSNIDSYMINSIFSLL